MQTFSFVSVENKVTGHVSENTLPGNLFCTFPLLAEAHLFLIYQPRNQYFPVINIESPLA